MLLFSILADDRCVHQEHIFHTNKKQKYPFPEEKWKAGNEIIHTRKAKLWKTLPPGGVRNNRNSKGTGGSRKDTWKNMNRRRETASLADQRKSIRCIFWAGHQCVSPFHPLSAADVEEYRCLSFQKLIVSCCLIC